MPVSLFSLGEAMPSEKRLVKYMHLLDSRPANFDPKGGYVYFVGGRNKVILVDSLRQIRREHRIAIQSAAKETGFTHDWANPARYRYVLVYVD